VFEVITFTHRTCPIQSSKAACRPSTVVCVLKRRVLIEGSVPANGTGLNRRTKPDIPRTEYVSAHRQTPCNAPCTSAGGKRTAKVGITSIPSRTPNPTSIYVCISAGTVSHSPCRPDAEHERLCPERDRRRYSKCAGPARAPVKNHANFRGPRCRQDARPNHPKFETYI
jgi:hypothetical protein